MCLNCVREEEIQQRNHLLCPFLYKGPQDLWELLESHKVLGFFKNPFYSEKDIRNREFHIKPTAMILCFKLCETETGCKNREQDLLTTRAQKMRGGPQATFQQ